MMLRNLLFTAAALVCCALPSVAATHARHVRVKAYDAGLAAPTTLASLTNSKASGNVMQAKDGNFYGVTNDGNAGGTGTGTLYMVTQAGGYSVVQTFSGMEPAGGVVQGMDGNLYGILTDNTPLGSGELFVYNIARKALLGPYALPGNGGESLAQDSKGNLYGVSTGGGTYGFGAVFQVALNPNNAGYPPNAPTITTLSSFSPFFSFADMDFGVYPLGTPVVASDGYLYGTTQVGTENTDGAVWKVNIAGGVLTPQLVGSFDAIGGSGPIGGIAEALDGNLYGVINAVGTDGYGGLYQVNLSTGVFRLFHAYSSSDQNTSVPSGTPLVTSTYDVITAGPGGSEGGQNDGTITDVLIGDSSGSSYRDLYDFAASSSGILPGSTPSAGSFSNARGSALVGNDTGGGNNSDGTVYAFESVMAPTIALTTSTTTLEVNSPITLNWNVTNAFSDSAKVCYANSSDWTFGGAIATSGSTTVTPVNPGMKQYSVTCGGVQSAVLNLNVIKGAITITSNPSIGDVRSGDDGYSLVGIFNGSAAPFPVSISLAGAQTTAFQVVDANCPAILAPGANCYEGIQFLAPSVNQARNYATIYTVANNGFTVSPSNTNTVTATDVPVGQITLSSTYHSFGTVSQPVSYTFTVYNGTGATQPFSQTATQVSGTAGTVSTSTTCPATLAIDTSCTVTVSFSTSSAGPFQVNDVTTTSATIKPGNTVKLTGTAN